ATWSKHPVPVSGLDLVSVAHGAGVYVAVGRVGNKNGHILSSTDGSDWVDRLVTTTSEWPSSIAFGGGKFVMVGSNGTIMTSPDGLNWTRRSAGTTSDLYSVTYGGDRFVVSGVNDTVLVSVDGAAWVGHRIARSSGGFLDMIFDGKSFVGVSGEGTIMTSPLDATTGVVSTGKSAELFGATRVADGFRIHLATASRGDVAVQIRDLSGKVVHEVGASPIGQKLTISTSGLAYGSYVLSVREGRNLLGVAKVAVTR
ncbi:MAG: hypothetical protein RL173_3008, partial [Fibrobacterota bacterium]